MPNNKPKLVVITGPTASGKSSLAIELALYFGAEIISADSMQVYRGMNVGTAKATVQERRGIPHHLIDMVNPDEEFNAALYRSHAAPLIMEGATGGRLFFLVGGTGLYIKTLLGGLLRSPPSDSKLREKLRQECQEHGTAFLYARLKERDPAYALTIHPNDRVRLIRALEITHLTQKRLSSLIKNHKFRERPFGTLKICLQMDREELYHRINKRSLAMIEDGLLEETEGLISKGYSLELKPMKSLGYRHMAKVLDETWKMDEAIRRLQTDTRRYAKRQLTWFRSDPEMLWKRPEKIGDMIKVIKEFYGEIYRQ
ncbi:MAG: tRNA (adenosine(37)-N6)-dimethylallyltransferase MiaA [Pseudomonadota bacterium]